MTESEWLACHDLKAMLAWPRDWVSGRKLRLFACACCRTEWDRIEDEDARKAIAAAERYADGLIRDSTITGYYQRAMHARDRARGRGDGGIRMLYQAVIEAALPNRLLHRVAAAYRLVGDSVAYAGPGPGGGAAAHERAIASFLPLLRDIAGNPFQRPALDRAWLSWHEGTIPTLAEGAYRERSMPSGELDPDRLAVLSDALEEAGCDDDDILAHLRSPGPHVRGCWVVDLLLGKE